MTEAASYVLALLILLVYLAATVYINWFIIINIHTLYNEDYIVANNIEYKRELRNRKLLKE